MPQCLTRNGKKAKVMSASVRVMMSGEVICLSLVGGGVMHGSGMTQQRYDDADVVLKEKQEQDDDGLPHRSRPKTTTTRPILLTIL